MLDPKIYYQYIVSGAVQLPTTSIVAEKSKFTMTFAASAITQNKLFLKPGGCNLKLARATSLNPGTSVPCTLMRGFCADSVAHWIVGVPWFRVMTNHTYFHHVVVVAYTYLYYIYVFTCLSKSMELATDWVCHGNYEYLGDVLLQRGISGIYLHPWDCTTVWVSGVQFPPARLEKPRGSYSQ